MTQVETNFRLLYRRGMIALAAVTAVAAGGRLLWEWLTPKPEPALSARLTREYLNRFRQLGVVAIKRDDWDIDVVRADRDTLTFSWIHCPSSSWPPAPPDFDVERQGSRLNAYGKIDKDRVTFAEFHDAVANCLNVGLAQAAHANQANASWNQS